MNPRYKRESLAVRASLGEAAVRDGVAAVARTSGLKPHVIRYLRNKAADSTFHPGLVPPACALQLPLLAGARRAERAVDDGVALLGVAAQARMEARGITRSLLNKMRPLRWLSST